VIASVLFFASNVLAQGVERNPATVVPSGQTVVVPDQAINNSPVLEHMIFIHYKDGFVKPGSGNQNPKATACYGFISKGAKLKSAKNLTINPSLDASKIMASAATWDAQTSSSLFDGYSIDPTANWDESAGDGRNEFSLGNYPQEGVIAITSIWGNFSGPPQSKEIVEFDILFDTDFAWGDATINPALMDLENIATHEIGHGVGLGDIYQTSCNLVTMYGYSTEGEIIKRTLESPDIAGVRSLYGI
jgi:hypothetical protein